MNESRPIIIPHLIKTDIVIEKLPKQDTPFLSSSLLNEILSFYFSKNIDEYYNEKDTLCVLLNYIGQSFLYPIELSDIISKYEQFLPKLFSKKVFFDNPTLYNSIIRTFVSNFSAVFDVDLYNEKIDIILSSTISIINMLFKVHDVNRFDQKTLEHMFYIFSLIIDNLISKEFTDLNINAKITLFVSILVDKIYDISTKEHDYWSMTKNIWSQWSVNRIFCTNWCTKMKSISNDYISMMESNKPEMMGEMDYKVFSFSKIIDISKITDILSFIQSLSNTIDHFTQTLYTTCKKKANVFIPKFPVNIISQFLIKIGLEVSNKIQNIDLITKIMKLISYSGYSENQNQLLEQSIHMLNESTIKFINNKHNSDEQKRKIFKSKQIFNYALMSQNSINLLPKLTNILYDFPNSSEDEILTYLSAIVSFSAVKDFRLPNEIIASYRDSITTLANKTENKIEDVLAFIYLLFLYGEKNFEQYFSQTILNFDSTKEHSLVSLFCLLAALPYSQDSETTKISLTYSLLQEIVEKCPYGHKITPFALLIALIEISAFSSLSFLPIIDNNKEKFSSYSDFVPLLNEAKIRKIRFKHKKYEEQSVDRFVYSNKIYSTTLNNPPKDQIVVIRDKVGTSIINIEELISDNGKEPLLSELPKGKETSAAKIDDSEYISIENNLPDTYLDIEEIPVLSVPQREKTSFLKNFGPSEMSDKRPPLLELLRLLDLIDNGSVKILPKSKEMEEYITKLDSYASLPTIFIPVYYVDQYSKSVTDRWNSEFISLFFKSFCKNMKQDDAFCITTNTMRIAFAKYNNEKCQDSPIAFLINNSDMSLHSTIFSAVKEKLFVSISPLFNHLFNLSIEKNTINYFLPFLSNKAKIIIGADKLAFHFVYLSLISLIDNPEIFTQKIKKREQHLSKIPNGITPLEYLCNYK